MYIPSLSSTSHPLCKEVVSLHDSQNRKELGLFIAEGWRICSTLIASKLTVKRTFVTQAFLDKTESFRNNDQLTIVSEPVMKKMSTTATPSGILTIFHIPPQPPLEQLSAGIVLAHVADPGNAGTLIRTAAALNYQTIVCIEGVDIWSPKVVQASAGAIGSLTLFSLPWEALRKIATQQQLTLAALVVEKGTPITDIAIDNKRLFVIGNEAHGIPPKWAAACDERVTLPMPGGTESLNAAVAGSIALYMAYAQGKTAQIVKNNSFSD